MKVLRYFLVAFGLLVGFSVNAFATNTLPASKRHESVSANPTLSAPVQVATPLAVRALVEAEALVEAAAPVVPETPVLAKAQAASPAANESVSPDNQPEHNATNLRPKKQRKGLWASFRKLVDGYDARAIIAIILGLPFILGGLGIHRVIMGGTPLLILAYIFTFGGLFGILPLLDTIFMIINPDHYLGNDRFFGFVGA